MSLLAALKSFLSLLLVFPALNKNVSHRRDRYGTCGFADEARRRTDGRTDGRPPLQQDSKKQSIKNINRLFVFGSCVSWLLCTLCTEHRDYRFVDTIIQEVNLASLDSVRNAGHDALHRAGVCGAMVYEFGLL